MQLFLDLFSGLATLITGAVAILIFFLQKKDTKKKAARVLLMEIRTAEERIDQIKNKVEGDNLDDFPSVFPTKSWKNYSHLFISDFDQDELKAISSFYDYGDLIEDLAKRNNNFFWVSTEERARVVQQKLADIVFHANTQEEKPSLEELKEKLLDAFSNDTYAYSPVKTVSAMRNYIQKIHQITTSSVGIKLKRLAKI